MLTIRDHGHGVPPEYQEDHGCPWSKKDGANHPAEPWIIQYTVVQTRY
jgi:hypothetical protein